MKLVTVEVPRPRAGHPLTLSPPPVDGASAPATLEAVFPATAAGEPTLVLVFAAEVPEAPPRPPRKPAAVELSGADREVFDALRAWRNGRAVALALPGYRVVPNRALASVAAARPRELAELATLRGLGPVTIAAHGADLLAALHRAEADVAPPEPS